MFAELSARSEGYITPLLDVGWTLAGRGGGPRPPIGFRARGVPTTWRGGLLTAFQVASRGHYCVTGRLEPYSSRRWRDCSSAHGGKQNGIVSTGGTGRSRAWESGALLFFPDAAPESGRPPIIAKSLTRARLGRVALGASFRRLCLLLPPPRCAFDDRFLPHCRCPGGRDRQDVKVFEIRI